MVTMGAGVADEMEPAFCDTETSPFPKWKNVATPNNASKQAAMAIDPGQGQRVPSTKGTLSV